MRRTQKCSPGKIAKITLADMDPDEERFGGSQLVDQKVYVRLMYFYGLQIVANRTHCELVMVRGTKMISNEREKAAIGRKGVV